MKSERNNPWFKPWFNILLHTQSIVCATVNSQCLEYLGYITLVSTRTHWIKDWLWSRNSIRGCQFNDWKSHLSGRDIWIVFVGHQNWPKCTCLTNVKFQGASIFQNETAKWLKCVIWGPCYLDLPVGTSNWKKMWPLWKRLGSRIVELTPTNEWTYFQEIPWGVETSVKWYLDESKKSKGALALVPSLIVAPKEFITAF